MGTMKFEDFLLTTAKKVQDKYQMELHALNNRHDPTWHELYAIQQRLRAATMVVEAIQATINEARGDVD
jgi:hypothetical protein